MNQASAATRDDRLHKIQQAVKWTVYLLLIINFVFYLFEDWNRALHTLTADSTFLDWTGEFATSIDESGWFQFQSRLTALKNDVARSEARLQRLLDQNDDQADGR